MIHHIENSRKSMQLCLTFSLIVGTWGWRSSADSVRPSWSRQLFWSHPRDDIAQLQEYGRALLTRLADSATSVTDTEPSEQWSSGESCLHSTWTCWNISGSSQRENPVFCSDNTLTSASVDDQTRSMDSHEIQCEKGHRNDSVREDSWTEIQKRDSSIGEQVLARRPGANVNQLMQPWVTGLWLGRDTLSDEHLTGTAAGVMRSRAARRLQEPARWVPAALNAMPFTPWSTHLNLPGRPRLQRPTYEEPIEVGTLPRFIEIPTAPTKNPKSETATLTPIGQSTKRRRQEVTFQEPLQTSSSAGAAAGTAIDSSMVILGPQTPKPVRPLSHAEREDSIQKRQRPTEVNTVLAIAGGKDQKALHTAKVNELRNMDNLGMVEVVDTPQSQQVL